MRRSITTNHYTERRVLKVSFLPFKKWKIYTQLYRRGGCYFSRFSDSSRFRYDRRNVRFSRVIRFRGITSASWSCKIRCLNHAWWRRKSIVMMPKYTTSCRPNQYSSVRKCTREMTSCSRSCNRFHRMRAFLSYSSNLWRCAFLSRISRTRSNDSRRYASRSWDISPYCAYGWKSWIPQRGNPPKNFTKVGSIILLTFDSFSILCARYLRRGIFLS